MSDDAAPISLDDWESALQEQAVAESTPPPVTEVPPEVPPSAQQSVDSLFGGMGMGMPASAPAAPSHPSSLASIFESFDQPISGGGVSTRNEIDLIMDIPVNLTVELGRTRIAVKNLLQLAQGSVVELEGMAGEPLDVLANGTLIAQGEVVVVNDKFGIRLTDVITPMERMKRLRR